MNSLESRGIMNALAMKTDELSTFCNALGELHIEEKNTPFLLPSFHLQCYDKSDCGSDGDHTMTNSSNMEGDDDDAVSKGTSPRHHRPHHHHHLSDEQIQRLFIGDEDGDNSLHIGILHGNESVVFRVIQLAPDFSYLSMENDLRQTALHLTVLMRQVRTTRRLICGGAEVNVPDRAGNTPLHLACALGYAEIVQQLIKPVDYEETLANNYTLPFQRIPQNLNLRNYDGYNCLHLATLHRHVDVVRLLLDTGLDISYGDGRSGRSALHLAAENGDMEILALLLERAGLLVDLPDFDGLTSFQLALGRGHQEVERLLLQNGARYKTLDFEEEDTDIDLSAVD